MYHLKILFFFTLFYVQTSIHSSTTFSSTSIFIHKKYICFKLPNFKKVFNYSQYPTKTIHYKQDINILRECPWLGTFSPLKIYFNLHSDSFFYFDRKCLHFLNVFFFLIFFHNHLILIKRGLALNSLRFLENDKKIFIARTLSL